MKNFFTLLFFLAGAVASAQPCFNMTVFPSALPTNQIISGDFNKDGNADLAASGINSSLVVWLGNGTGTYSTYSSYGISGGNNYYLCSGDFNNDGNLDIATVSNAASNVCVLFGSATGTFVTSATYTVGASPMSICAADFNKDGNLDLATTYSAGVSVLLATSAGSYSSATNYTVSNGPYDLCAADFTGDGNADLVCTNFSSSTVTMLSGSANGAFTVGLTYNTNGSGPAGIAKLDFNNDGLTDIVVCNESSNNYCVMLNNGSGGFNSMPGMSIGSQQQPRNIAVAEFNNTPPVDLVMADFSSFSPYYASIAYNGSSAIGVSTGSGSSPHGVCTGDFNNDGKPDFAIANQGSSNICVYINTNPYLNITGSSAICTGQSTTLTASGATTYTWSSNANSANTSTVSVNPTANTTYTVSGISSGCSQTAQTTFSVAVNPIPSSLTIFYNGPSTICQGDTTTMQATVDPGTTNVWMPGNLTTTAVAVSPTVTTNYTVTSTYTATGCSYSSNYPTITVKTSPTLTVSATATAVCNGAPVTLTASGANTYTWSGGISNGVAFNPATTTTYSVVGTATNNCTGKATTSITVYQLPTVIANASPAGPVCAGTSLTLTGSGSATTYTWSGGVTNGVAFPATFQSYTVTGVDVNNCSNTATISVNAPANPAPNICMLTADSLALNNIIYWDKSLYPTADSFIVYRYDAFSSNYLVIGTVSKDSSHFTDTQRNIGGPNGGDPQYGSWQYKLAVKDTCGNTGGKSPYHQSVFVQDQHNNNFNWNAYTIETGQSNPVTGYSFLRDDNNTGAWHVLINTAGLSATDPNYLSYPNGNWRVDALGFNCSATLRTINGVQSTVVKSKSNISNNRTTGVRGDLRKQVSLYPNPSNGNTTLSFSQYIAGNVSLTLYSALGNEVYSRQLMNPSGEIQLDFTSFENGIYFLKIVTANQALSIPVTKH